MEAKNYIKLGISAIKLTNEVIKDLTVNGIIEHQDDGYYFISKLINPLDGKLSNVYKEKFSVNDYAVLDRDVHSYYNIARIYRAGEFESIYKSTEEITFK